MEHCNAMEPTALDIAVRTSSRQNAVLFIVTTNHCPLRSHI